MLKVHITNGAVILPGEAVATIAAQGYVLRMRLPERHARFIRRGNEVQVESPAPDNAEPGNGRGLRTGIVQQVYPEMDQGRVVADVEVEGLGGFFVGERVRVYVTTGKRSTFIIPAGYLLSRFGLTYVRLKDGGDIVVQTGQRTGGAIEILSGIMAGDVLVAPSLD